MDCIHDFDEELRLVFETVEQKVSSSFVKFQKNALDYLAKYKSPDEEFGGSYFCFLLPFWVKDPLRLDNITCREISIGNIFGLFYFLIQDAVMDTAPGEYKGDLLPVGNLVYFEFIEQYQKLFPAHHLFWRFFKKYLTEWADSVIWERQEHWGRKWQLSEKDLTLIAHKSAPLKITSAAIGLLSGDEAAIEPLSNILDCMMISMQLLDDWMDWREDLASGNCTTFLSMVMNHCKIDDFVDLNESHIAKAVYAGNILEVLFNRIPKNHTFIEKISKPYGPYLLKFHETLVIASRQILDEIKKERNLMMQGGVAYWLVKSMNNK